MTAFQVRKKLFDDDPDVRTLDTLTDDELLEIIDRLCLGFLMVNYRDIAKVEASYHATPDEGSLYIRVTTVTKAAWQNEKPEETQVYGLQFDLTYDEELLYTPMNRSVWMEEGLRRNGITHDIAEHLLDIRKFYELFSTGFKLWSTKGILPANPATTFYPEWREVHSKIIAQINAC